MASENYLIRRADRSDANRITSLLHKYHTAEDSITQGFFANKKRRLTADEEKSVLEATRELVLLNPCLVAIHRNTFKIVGAIVLIGVDQNSNSKVDKRLQRRSELVHELNDSMWKICDSARLFEKFPDAKTAVKLRCLTIHKNHRGKGLAKALLRESMEWARRNDYGFVYSLFTPPAAKRAASSVGLKKVLDYDLNMLRNSEGSLMFEDLSPNNVTSVMVAEVNKIHLWT